MPAIASMAIGHLLERNTPTSKCETGESNDVVGRAFPPSVRAVCVAPQNPAPAMELAPAPAPYFSPSLYATPDAAPIAAAWPASSPPSSPSSLVLNRTRRGSYPQYPASLVPIYPAGNHAETTSGAGEEGGASALNMCRSYGSVEKGCQGAEEGAEDEDDFFDPRETMSAGSSSEAEEARRSSCFDALHTSQSNYYDVGDDLLSDGSFGHSPSFNTNHDAGIHALTANIIEEVEKRQRAEKELIQLRTQWQMMKDGLSKVGISFPDIQSNEEQLVPVAQLFFQELVVGRVVCDAVERGIARAETEELAESVINTKNHEISRLQDRLQYYETVNHEMSQRNLEIAELTRRKRLSRRRRQKFIWSVLGFSMTVGASLLAYSYLPGFTEKEVPPAESDSPAASDLIQSP